MDHKNKKKIFFFLKSLSTTLPIPQSTRSRIREQLFGKFSPHLDSSYPKEPHTKIDCELSEKPHTPTLNDIPRVEYDSSEENFLEYSARPHINSKVKAIAFYLPQFHTFKENDDWWGKGFTEWTNVTKAKPNFEGHHQPHLPIHFGFYDLRVPSVMEDQIKIAKEHGIYGFNYYFYWFDGKTLMEEPLLRMLNDPKIDMPFCLTWANENWTRRWDGQENDVLISQNHSHSDSLNFIKHLIKYFNDDRYIKIDGKPILVIYRADIIPQINKTLELWRAEIKKHNFPGIYLVCAQTFGIEDPNQYGFDAAMEFPPHTVKSEEVSYQIDNLNKDFSGHNFCYEQVVKYEVQKRKVGYKKFRTAMLSWDNTARKQLNAHTFIRFSHKLYKQWLNHLCNEVYHDENYTNEEKIIFVNAWNEWAEGTHLEPDRKYGFRYLSSTYDVLSNFTTNKFSHKLNEVKNPTSKKTAFIIHVYYKETIEQIFSKISFLDKDSFDIYVSSNSLEILDQIKNKYEFARTLLVENRGRDILPFLQVLKKVINLDYTSICKIHGKKSEYRKDGDSIRNEIFSDLIGDEKTIYAVTSAFDQDNKLGMICPTNYFIEHTDKNMYFNKLNVKLLSEKLGLKFENFYFPAGSMFWFRPESLRPITKLDSWDFELELGLADGTAAHAIERLFAICASSQGYKVIGSHSIQLTKQALQKKKVS